MCYEGQCRLFTTPKKVDQDALWSFVDKVIQWQTSLHQMEATAPAKCRFISNISTFVKGVCSSITPYVRSLGAHTYLRESSGLKRTTKYIKFRKSFTTTTTSRSS